MNFGTLLPKASFALLLLIFGCLIYIIARDHRLAALRQAQEAEQIQQAQAARLESTNHSTEAAATPRQQPEFAPLRPRPGPAAFPVPNPPAAQRPRPIPEPIARAAATDAAQPVAANAQPEFAAFAGTSSGSATGAGASGAGSAVNGQVLLRGTPPPEVAIALDPTCGRIHAKPLTTRHYIVGEGGGLANVFVYLKSGSVSTGPPIARSVLLDQVGCEYQPYVLGVQVNQPLIVQNSDPLLHNVHVLPKTTRERNIAQPIRGMTSKFTFPRQEVFVRFKCDVHPWMFAYVGVVDHPWYTVTDKDGKFTLPSGLTAGRYTLAAIHPKAGELTQDITVSDGGNEPVIFTYELADALARPAPTAGQAALRRN